nr:DDE-type integrase/transposase/recombinase [Bifidobacterium dentium]
MLFPGRANGKACTSSPTGRGLSIPSRGDASKAYPFVGVLPFSRYAFVEPTPDMGRNTWLRCHVAMYEWFGGSAPRLVCDNLKAGVVGRPREGEVVLNDAYRSMAGHYSAAVIPGRVRRPKDKPSAGNTVCHATMALVGAMRDRLVCSCRWTSCASPSVRGRTSTIPARSGNAAAPDGPCSGPKRGRC